MNDYRDYVENDYNVIYHHGVKGQKWGQRRYQNSDGSLTPEGRERYLTLNFRGRLKYKVPKTSSIAKIGGAVAVVSGIDAITNKTISSYSSKGNRMLKNDYGIASTSLNKKLSEVSSSRLKRSKKSAAIALAAVGLTSAAVIANEIRKKKIMKQLSGTKNTEK